MQIGRDYVSKISIINGEIMAIARLLSILLALTSTLVFMPAEGVCVSTGQQYRLASGDVIKIHVFGEDDLNMEVRLDGTGIINYPFLGKLRVMGLTIDELESRLTRGLRNGYLLAPQVNVSMLEHRPFFIEGEVKSPGAYAYAPGLTIRKAISMAGGFTEFASRQEFKVVADKSSRKKAGTVGVAALIGPGDSIIVGKSVFYIEGEVKQPGVYAHTPGLTIRRAISLAGGFTEFASRQEFKIVADKASGDKEIVKRVSSQIKPGDSIIVEKSIFYIDGEVNSAGSYPYRPGLTLREAVSLAGGLTERASESNITIVSKDGKQRAVGGMASKLYMGDSIRIKQSFF